ncbi:hypothetical protein acdb102_48530 [Acidothermaceae bacterium B102]|nr:hypothetical protein acdb102_48530 [Acidothermaceae bacterium B102]
MTDETAAPDLESAAQANKPDGAGGQRPPASNQRAGEAPASGTSDEAVGVDDRNPDTPQLPASGAHRPSAPSGEVAPQ